MTFSPGGPGYPPAQQHGPYAPTTQFNKVGEGPSKLPVYLLAAVVGLGLLVYLFSFGPMFKITNSEFPQLGGASGTSIGLGFAVIAALLAALLAGVGMVPKQKSFTSVVAVLAVLSFLLVIAEIINKPSGVSIDWALYVVIVLTAFEALAAVGVLLLDAGVITPPAPRPKYDQFQPYGQYYGQPGQHPGQQHAPQVQQNFGQQRPGYPQYGGYGPGAPTTAFPASGPQAGPPTPPTGFPTYGQPPSPQAPTQAIPQPQQQQQDNSSSAQPGPAPS
jgi:hypothetical protein